jgi:hypothetical protein
MFRTKILSLAAFAALAISMQPAAAQQMGRDGYNFPARSNSMAAQFDFQARMQAEGNAATTSGAMGALNQYVTQYTTNSTAIANMNQVNQTTTDGSTATLSTATDQGSTGNQDSVAKSKVKVDNSLSQILAPLAPTN